MASDWEYDQFGCTSCGSALCDGYCPEAAQARKIEQDELNDHYNLCNKDGFCYICQCL